MSTAKVITIIGSSPESFAKAADVAVQEAAQTVRGIHGAHVVSMSATVANDTITEYRTTVDIAFEVEQTRTRSRADEEAIDRLGRLLANLTALVEQREKAMTQDSVRSDEERRVMAALQEAAENYRQVLDSVNIV
jgi:dodecin